MHVKPVRYHSQHCLHFLTFICYHRMKLLDSAAARDTFEQELERVRCWYGSFVTGYVVMPEHVHLLLSEPERGKLSLVIQMLKQITSRKLKAPDQPRFWQVRYYDFPVWSEAKRIEKLRYIHRKSCHAWIGGAPRELEMEQLRTLRDRSGKRSGNRVAVGSASPRTAVGCTNRVKSPPSRTERGKSLP